MIIADLLSRMAHAKGLEREQAFAELEALAGDPAAYQGVVETLATSSDDQLLFWCLDTLIKRFGPSLPVDAPRLIPLLLRQLVHPRSPVVDRAAWALSVAGPTSVTALLDALSQASEPAHCAAYLGALRQNHHLPAHATAVQACLTHYLQDPAQDVRYWAMVVIMDISPLRPWFNPAFEPALFEPLYARVLPVAEAFVQSREEDISEFAGLYRDLILAHWEGKADNN